MAQQYGFTDEQLDFVINYDIKYRMGRGALTITAVPSAARDMSIDQP